MKFANERIRRRRDLHRGAAGQLSAEERARRNKLKRRNLWLESLEDRSLMATLNLVVNLYEDNAGSPGALITTDTVVPGQEFFVEITAKDTSTVPSGINGLALDVSFNSTAFEEIDSPFDPASVASPLITSAFPLFRSGTLDNTAGTIDELRGGSSQSTSMGSPIGIATFERFALLKFRADAAVSNSPLVITIGSNGVTFEDNTAFDNSPTIEAQTITVAAPALPTLSINDVTLSEGSDGTFTNYTFNVTLSEAATAAVDVQIDTVGGTATSGTDFDAITAQVLTFAIGETAKTVTVKVAADTGHEPDESFQVKLSAPVNATIADDTGTGTILNDDTVTASITKTLSLAEGNTGTTAAEFTVTLDKASSADVVIPWSFTHGTTSVSDFDSLVTTGNVTILAGQTSAKIPAFLVTGDLRVELDETFSVTLGAPVTAGVVLSADQVGTGTIENEDSAEIVITAPVAAPEGSTGNTNPEFTVTLSAPVDVDVSFNYQTQDGTAKTSGNDYVPVNGTLTFLAGNTTAQKIPVSVVSDGTVELDEQFSVLLDSLSAAGYDVTLKTATANATITNDDSATITLIPLSQVEGDAGTTNMVFEAVLSNPVDVDVTVEFNTTDGTAKLANNDYIETKGTLTFLAGGSLKQTIIVPIVGDTDVETDENFTVTLSNVAASGRDVTAGAAVNGTILDDDDTTPTISIDDVSISEDDSGETLLTFTVSLSAKSASPVDLKWSTQDGTASDASDYTAVSLQTLTIPADTLSQTITVKVQGDKLVEKDETLKVILSDITGAKSGDLEGVGTITNDDFAVASITESVIHSEGNAATTDYDFTVSLDQAASFDVVIPWSFNHTTTNAADFDGTLTTSGKVTILAGEKSAKIPSFKVVGDLSLEANETFTVGLGTPEQDEVSASVTEKTGTGTITNDDDAVVSITSQVKLNEGNSGTTDFDFAVSLDVVAGIDVVVPWSFTHTSTDAADFDGTLTTSGKVTIPAGTKSVTISPTFKVVGDKTVELEEKFLVTLGTPETAGASLSVTEQVGEGTIQNDDGIAVIVASITPTVSQSEGDAGTTNYEFTVSIDQVSATDVVIPWTFTHVDTEDSDFSAGFTKSGKVTILAGQTSAKIPAFTVLGDATLEGDESFTVTLEAPETSGVTLSSDDVGTGEVLNDDAVEVSIESKVTQNEASTGTTSYEFLVSLDQAAEVDVVVPWTFAHGTTDDDDFSPGLITSGKVTILAGQTSAKISAFSVIGDTTLETDESFTVTLDTPETTGATLNGMENVAIGEITNDDQVIVSITKNLAQAEGDSGTNDYEFTVSINQIADVDVVIPWTFAHVNSADSDFSSPPTTSGKVTIPAGLSSVKIPAFVTVGDTTVENDETFTVTLNTPETEGAVLSSTDKVGTGNIQNDDGLTASISNASITEGNSGTATIEFTVTLDQNATTDVVIPWTFDNVTTLDTDFTSLTKSGKVTIVSGSKTAKISFTVNGDTTLEGNEDFTVSLGTPETADVALSVDKVGTGTITNDDQVTVSVTKTNSQAEGNSSTKDFDFTVTLDQAAEIDVVVPWAFAHVSTNDADFTAGLTKSGKITIPAGQTSIKIPSFQVNGDTSFEGDETFTVTLNTPETAGAVLSSDKVGEGKILNDDTIVASITKTLSQNEGNSGTTAYEFTVTIDQVSSVDVVIPWNFANVTTADSDFTGALTKSGKVTIPAGQTSIKIPAFLANGDTTIEANETFTVTLGAPETAGVTLSNDDKVGTATLVNDDSATASITKTVTQNEGNSGNTAFDFTVTLDKASNVDVVIPWTMANVTTTDADFATGLTKTGKITIPAGQTSIKIPSFSILGNNIVEGNETFTVTLGTPETAGVSLSSTDSVGTGTVTNDDAATFSIGNAALLEPSTGTGDLVLPVTLSAPADVDITVSFTYTAVTTTDADFSNLTKTGTLTFLAGQTTPTTPLTFKVAADTIDETDETFTVTLGDPVFPSGVTRNVTTPSGTKVGTGTIQADSKNGVLSGWAYVDKNKNGVRDTGEVGIPGVIITLNGTTTGGAAVTLTAMTADDGSYSFTNLVGGKYSLTESHPAAMFDGIDVAGTAGGTMTNDKISDIQLDAAEQATANNFGERGLLPKFISKRLLLASTPAAAVSLRVINSRAAAIAGNQTLADQISNSSIPSVVAANPTTTANTQSAGEFIAEAPNNNNQSAGEYIDEALAQVTSQSVVPETPVVPVATPAAKVASTKTAATKAAAKTGSTSAVASKISSRSSAIQSLRSAASPSFSDTLELLALDQIAAREKKGS
ncbi:Calx-beta domain protein [Anatilimnocola aggregata]|uniref:Calx-beta domain protein n=1 Tax=Anatilimnocola aggregata TaxID=2528021 RepID=A0A517YBU3_9BACT|nr:Calx-beta domain-containing protein [Anatilimnocola aggregata]QDU27718.1 Calx-beta domain protein [Anatilimnocola aggregata]